MTAAVTLTPSSAPPLHLVDEINHRVVNEYTEAISSLSLAAARTPSAHAKAALREAAERLHAHAESHRTLAAPTADGPANLGEYAGRIGAAACRASLAERGLRLLMRTEDIWLDRGRCWRAGLILSELIRNAARHGLRDKAGVIRVEVCERGGEVVCLVCNDGGVCSAPQPGRGQRLVRALAADLGGSVDWEFTPWASAVTLRFPLVTANGCA